MSEFRVAGMRVVVVGGARSGVAAAELLVARGAQVVMTDTRATLEDEASLRQAGVALELGGHDARTLVNADLIVISPGVPSNQPAILEARRAGVPIIGEIELASRWLQGRVVAITGTKGKSTTTSLTGRILNAAGLSVLVGGNIGDPLSAQVDRSTPDAIHVVEVSSFQLESTVTFHPWIAVFLNFSADHLDRHASFEEYAAAKQRIFANQDDGDWAVINADDPHVLALARGARAQQRLFALTSTIREGVVVDADTIAMKTGAGTTPLVPVASVRLLGRHLLSDVLAAVTVGTVVGVSAETMTRAVAGFSGLEHALEPAGEIDGVRFVNDSKATNVEAARAGIESFEERLAVIIGGRFKGGDLRLLREPLATRAVAVIAIGEARPLVRDALGDVAPVREVDTMGDAVRAAYAAAAPKGTVLLAPACASFDMFRDYAERGRVFKQEVERLAQELAGAREQ